MPVPTLLRIVFCVSIVVCTANAQHYTFKHFAGTAGGPSYEDGIGSGARFDAAHQAAVDEAGNIYIADAGNHTIRKITPAGTVTTVAGTAGQPGSRDGRGSTAQFYHPSGIAVAPDGTLYVSDRSNHLIRRITISGEVTTVAGTAGSGGRHSDGPAAQARFYYPEDLVIDTDGTLYVADSWNHVIRRISAEGTVSTIAGKGGWWGHEDGIGEEARFLYPSGLAIAGDGTLYVVSWNAVRTITRDGLVETLAGLGDVAGSVDDTGTAARFRGPEGIAVSGAGVAYVADSDNHTIRAIAPGGAVTTLAGLAGSRGATDAVGSHARFSYPLGIAVDAAGDLIVTSGSAIRRLTTAGGASTIAGMAAVPGTADGIGAAARFNEPTGIAVDDDGNVFVADKMNHAIREIDDAGTVSTLAGLAGSSGAVDGTGSEARFNGPMDVAVDASKSVFVIDTLNHKLRKISDLGRVTTFGDAYFWYPRGVAVDPRGWVYATDNYHAVQRIDGSGGVSTLAGVSEFSGSSDGNGAAARFNYPAGMAVDATGNVFVADEYNHTIRRITPAGDVTTFVGMAGQAGSTDGLGSAARFNHPQGVAIDAAGNLFIADAYNGTIRKVTGEGRVTTIGGSAGVSASTEGTGSAAHFISPEDVAVDTDGNVFVVDRYGHSVRKGVPAIADVATIDAPSGPTGAVRRLGTSPETATSWLWEVIRQPSGSTATLPSATARNPTFTPDVAELYVFRLTASSAAGTSITTVSLLAGSSTMTTLQTSTTSTSCAITRTLTATVSSPSGTPDGGSVTFRDLGAFMGNVPLVSGRARLTVALPTGTHMITAEYTGSGAYLSSASESIQQEVGVEAPMTPVLTATATSTTSASLAWTVNACSSGYLVSRSANGAPFQQIAQIDSPAFKDSGLTPGTTYLYKVRAFNTKGEAESAIDAATTIVFADKPLVARSTSVRAIHFAELRAAVNAFRAAAGLPAHPFADPIAFTAPILATHLSELRSALAEARTTLAMPIVSYTDPEVVGRSTTVKAAHVEQLRSAVQ